MTHGGHLTAAIHITFDGCSARDSHVGVGGIAKQVVVFRTFTTAEHIAGASAISEADTTTANFDECVAMIGEVVRIHLAVTINADKTGITTAIDTAFNGTCCHGNMGIASYTSGTLVGFRHITATAVHMSSAQRDAVDTDGTTFDQDVGIIPHMAFRATAQHGGVNHSILANLYFSATHCGMVFILFFRVTTNTLATAKYIGVQASAVQGTDFAACDFDMGGTACGERSTGTC